MVDDSADLGEISGSLQRLAEKHFGSSCIVKNLKRPPMLGGANETFIFDVEQRSKIQRLVLRRQTYFENNSPFLAMSHQYTILQKVFRNKVATPEPLFELESTDCLGKGFVMRFVEGETIPRKILANESLDVARRKLTEQCGRTLAQIHRLSTEEFNFLGGSADSKDALQAQIERYEKYGGRQPALELAIRWLQKNRREYPVKRLLHGDFRLGNIVVGHEGFKYLLDWDCCHLGDPMEELAWLCLKSWRFGKVEKKVGGFGDREILYRSYLDNGGYEISQERISWWKIFGYLRWAVLNMMQIHGHINSSRKSLPFAICGRNICLIEYDLLMALKGEKF